MGAPARTPPLWVPAVIFAYEGTQMQQEQLRLGIKCFVSVWIMRSKMRGSGKKYALF